MRVLLSMLVSGYTGKEERRGCANAAPKHPQPHAPRKRREPRGADRGADGGRPEPDV